MDHLTLNNGVLGITSGPDSKPGPTGFAMRMADGYRALLGLAEAGDPTAQQYVRMGQKGHSWVEQDDQGRRVYRFVGYNPETGRKVEWMDYEGFENIEELLNARVAPVPASVGARH
ncbi:hypothetical protein [Burkholderia vietnamiensis]|uniref:hypothetical protein n=1 Tax=Burkholderia vietnamiensis TaxID=60552 RepID=UPI001CF5A8A6|nr:hypothetical protein [Burkholderia vietnamiensis]MCA8448965.1 hypothetical protein [Burkholderia vietnamiensis]